MTGADHSRVGGLRVDHTTADMEQRRRTSAVASGCGHDGEKKQKRVFLIL